MVWAAVRLCLACLTAEAANKHEGWQWCVYHSSQQELPLTAPRPSAYAVLAEALVHAFASEPWVATEWRALRQHHGGFDFSMPVLAANGQRRWVHVDVDGETHTSRARQGSSLGQQQARDRRKDEAAWGAHLMLVRLHHADIPLWGRLLRLAACYARHERRQRFILYTKSYGELGLSGERRHSKVRACSPCTPCPSSRWWCG